MLTEQDIKTINETLSADTKKELVTKRDLITKVVTKEDMVDLREDADGLRENVQVLVLAVDGLNK